MITVACLFQAQYIPYMYLLQFSFHSTASYSDQPLFTLKQVVAVCQHMLKEREEQVRENYNKVLTTKLAGQMITSSPNTLNSLMVCSVWFSVGLEMKTVYGFAAIFSCTLLCRHYFSYAILS